MLQPPRIAQDVRRHKLPAWVVAFCCAGVVTNALAQTNAAAPPVPAKPDAAKAKGNAGPDLSRNFILIPPHGEDWTRHFQVGAIMAFGISAKFHESGNFPVQHDPGTYDDGYVHADDSGDASATSNWGYENASQYDAAARTLTFHSVTSFGATGDAKSNGDPSFGLDLAYGDDFAYYKPARTRIGWEIGLNFLPINVKDTSTLNGSVNQDTVTYDTGPSLLPEAPYHGSPSGGGAEILTPASGSTSSSLGNQQITGSRSLDMDLFAFRLGPSFFWDVTQNLGLSFSGGPVIGCVTGHYNYDETIDINGVSSHNRGSFGDTDMVYGGYVNAMLKYHIVDNGRNAFLFLGAQYTPMTSAHFSSGGRSANLNLSGQVYISAGMGWPF